MTASMDRDRRKKVAIVGTGPAGIAALWALNRTHHDVYLYEAASRLGGKTDTVEWKAGRHKTLIDIGFMVMNSATNPNFLNFLNRVHIPTAPAELTLSASIDGGAFEWAGTTPGSLFCQRENLLSPRMWRMVFDLIRFRQFALDVLLAADMEARSSIKHGVTQHRVSIEETIGEYLEREGYSDTFRDDYIIPMAAAILGISSDGCTLECPAVTLIRLLWNLGLLSTIGSRPQWLTTPDGSRAYVDAVMKGFPSNHRFLSTAIRALTNDEDGRVRLHLDGDRSEVYDHVILATQGDEAFALVEETATAEEREILSQFRSATRTVILHGDRSLMPRSRKAWSGWNCITQSSPGTAKGDTTRASITYNMNMLHGIPEEVFGTVLVTDDPLHDPDPKTVQGRYTYRQPLYNPNTAGAQKRLQGIQNTRGISYAGSWTRDGSHEDGFSSGLHVAHEHLGARLPFRLGEYTSGGRHRHELGVVDLALRLLVLIIQVFFIEVINMVVGTYRARTRRPRPHINRLNGVVKKKE